MGFRCGIVGLPNVGKSTLFNALTKLRIETGNFPFCTIEPHIGCVPIPDPRLNQLSEILKSKRTFPTTMEFIDIAGLVQGASIGEGLGNKFLSTIREADAIAHLVRCFEHDEIIHVSGKVNPIKDIDIINTELVLSDLDTCKRAIQRCSKKQKADENILLVLQKCLTHLKNIGMLRELDLNKEEKELVLYLNFLTLKPTMYIANVNEYGFENNQYLDQVRSFASKEGSIVLEICATLEVDILELNQEERTAFMIDLGLKEPALYRLIRAGYELLNLQSFFTAGMKEVRAWSIPFGTTALKAAGKIHTDFEKGFIRAQIISFLDFLTYKGEQGAKKAGKMRVEGKDYIVNDGDIINFLFNI